jgi:hypothetical protein
LYINSKIFLQVVPYNGFYQIVEFRSTLWPLGVNDDTNNLMVCSTYLSSACCTWYDETRMVLIPFKSVTGSKLVQHNLIYLPSHFNVLITNRLTLYAHIVKSTKQATDMVCYMGSFLCINFPTILTWERSCRLFIETSLPIR